MKYTEQQIITAMKGTGGIVSQILKKLSEVDNAEPYTRQALYKRIDENPRLKEAYQAEQEHIGDIVETGFFRALQDEKEWAMKEWFRYKGWTRGYTPKTNTDITTGGDKLTVIIEDVYANKPKFRQDNTTAETAELAEGSSQE